MLFTKTDFFFKKICFRKYFLVKCFSVSFKIQPLFVLWVYLSTISKRTSMEWLIINTDNLVFIRLLFDFKFCTQFYILSFRMKRFAYPVFPFGKMIVPADGETEAIQ